MGIFKKKSKTDNKALDKKDKEKERKLPKTSMKELYGQDNKKTVDKKSIGEKKEVTTISTRNGVAYKVLVRPVITEKAADLGVENKYVFAVNPKANKIEVAKAIDELYGVKPLAVNIIKVRGKKVRQGRYIGKRKDWKKAIVTLPAGKTIKVYEGV